MFFSLLEIELRSSAAFYIFTPFCVSCYFWLICYVILYFLEFKQKFEPEILREISFRVPFLLSLENW